MHAPFADFGHYFDIVANFKDGIAPGKAAQDEIKHANQHQRAKNVGGEAVDVANDAVGQEFKASDEPFGHVDGIDEEVEKEAPGDAVVEERGEFAVADDAPLGEEATRPVMARRGSSSSRSLPCPRMMILYIWPKVLMVATVQTSTKNANSVFSIGVNMRVPLVIFCWKVADLTYH